MAKVNCYVIMDKAGNLMGQDGHGMIFFDKEEASRVEVDFHKKIITIPTSIHKATLSIEEESVDFKEKKYSTIKFRR